MKRRRAKILFVKSTINSQAFSYDLGIGLISSVLLDKGYEVDLFVLKSLDQLFLLNNKIQNCKPSIVAFSTHTSSFQSVIQISKYIKKTFPDIYQVVGGVHAILQPGDLEKAPYIDALCFCEGEIAFLDFIERWEKNNDSHLLTPGFLVRNNKEIIKNKMAPIVSDLDTLLFPERRIFYEQGIVGATGLFENKIGLEFLFTRGCPFNCRYCSNLALRTAFGKSNYIRHISPKRAIEWIKHDTSLYAHDFLMFHDDTFSFDKRWLLEFLRLYKDVKIPFVCNIRVGTVNKDDLIMLKKCGCIGIYIGVESGDEEIRKNVLDRRMSNKSIIQVFDWAREIGLGTLAYLMIGLPEETPSSFLKTVELFNRLSPSISGYGLSVFYPYPGTELYQYCKKNKYLMKHQSKDFIERSDTILQMPQFKRADILYLREKFEDLVINQKKREKFLPNIYHQTKYFLLSIPPSSLAHKSAQIVLEFLNLALYIKDRTIKNIFRKR